MKSGHLKLIFILLFSFLAASCATYQSKVSGPRTLLQTGQITEALEKFRELAEVENKDQLVHLMDYATALQIAGKYKESSQQFIKADRMVDLNDYHSVTNVLGATLGGEESIQYKGESYEKFLINTLNAINFVMMGDLDAALVEARRINEKISKMKMDGREPYELSPFAKYLAGVLWEAQKKYDDAYIDYEGSYKLDGANPLLPVDLIRSAKLARRPEAHAKWKAEFRGVIENPAWYEKGKGELVVIYQQGWGPQKQARQQYRFPELYPVRSMTRGAQIQIENIKTRTELVYDIERVSIRTLEKDFGALVARRAGGIAAKAVVADQIRQKDELLGQLAWIAMNLSDRADLRQWSLLPQSIQMARIPMAPGQYKVTLQGLDSAGFPTADVLVDQAIAIKPGQKTFLNWRSLR
jgi:hypothetical protein